VEENSWARKVVKKKKQRECGTVHEIVLPGNKHEQ
jgi:hypothetical protein